MSLGGQGERRVLRAFTLVEMLVAVAVLSILVLLLAEIANRASAAWMRGEAQANRSQAVRAILGFLGTDLRSAVRPLDAEDQSGFQFIENPGALSSDFQNRDAIFWQAAVSGADRGDIAVVGYFVRWFQEDGLSVPRLCRVFIESADADGSANANFLVYDKPDAWLIQSVVESEAPASQGAAFEGLLADNVPGLWVKCYDQEGNRIENFDSRVQKAMPSRVEVSLVVMDTRAARRLDSALESTIRSLVGQAGSADEFLEKVQDAPGLSSLREHMIPYQGTFHLESAP